MTINNDSRSKKPVTSKREVAKVNLEGDFLDDVLKVSEGAMSLLISPGELAPTEEKVLVPFVAVTMSGESEFNGQGVEKVFSDILSIENSAYVLATWSDELARVTEELLLISSGTLKPNYLQMKQMAIHLELANDAIARCRESVGQMMSQSPVLTPRRRITVKKRAT